MNKIFYVLIVFALLLSSCTNYINEEELIKPVEKAQKVASFPVVGKLKRFTIGKGYIFIQDTKDIYCYDFKSLKLIKKLVKHGEGPGEFTRVPWIYCLKDGYVLRDALDKNVFLDESFEFIREHRVSWLSGTQNEEFGDNFIILKSTKLSGKGPRTVFSDTYSLADKELKKIKTITSIKTNPYDLYFPCSNAYLIINCKLFVKNSAKGFHFDVFNKDGNYIYSIDKNIRKVRTKKKHILRREKAFLLLFGEKIFKEWQAASTPANTLPAPKYLPDIHHFWVNENRIYVKTLDFKDNRDKYIIMNLKGKIIKIVYLPSIYLIGRSTFHNNKFYYFKDNGKNETWNLYSIQL